MARIDHTLRAARSGTEPGEAELLLAHVLGRPRSWLYAHGDDSLDKEASARFDDLLARRRAGEPVAYLLGQRGFRDFDLRVAPAVLIPRPETELLVELALDRLPDTERVSIADLGTGSGAIAIALARERPLARVVATDASADALQVAIDNAGRLGVPNIEFSQGDWLTPLAGASFDLIASNPPYIAQADVHLGQGDLRFEPREALVSGEDGLDALRVITRDAPRHLVPGGWLLLEHGWNQGERVRGLLREAGLAEVATFADLEQRDRTSLGRKPD
ncbi:peptide chain release factor N(5)-glutamine methyltransferase [Lysobacter sp. A289]